MSYSAAANPSTRAEIEALVNQKAWKDLDSLLTERMAFGTAGLRAAMGAGFSRMNDLTVIQATQGLCQYMLKVNPDVSKQGVVVGHDHRHHSLSFAQLTAAVFISKGIKVYYYKNLTHTPLVPYGVKKLKAAAGIMITASHNPKQDNGYKVYWSNACQIIPPHDTGIADMILQHLQPWTWDYELCQTSPLSSDPSEQLAVEYFEDVKKLSYYHDTNSTTDLTFCYTAMHGVGWPFAERSFKAFGHKPFVITPEQVEPNPDFPTVEYPNPEEGKGALTLAMKAADAANARIILANDPDADRLAIAEKLSSTDWHIYSGNEIGSILGCWVWENYQKSSKKSDKGAAMLASTVSSKMLEVVAKKEGFYFEDTLTGFKWLGNRAITLSEQGYDVVFAFEEAIGFMVGDIVHDKDGVSALSVVAELAVELSRKGMRVYDYLQQLYQRYGFFVSNNSYFICHEAATIQSIFDKIRYGAKRAPAPDHSYSYPTHLGGFKVTSVRDLTVGYDTSTSDHIPKLPSSASSQMITFRLENDCVITLRTSGTEPKIKYYSELSGSSKESATASLDAIIADMTDKLLEPQANKLGYRKP
ncbi:phosphoglucosamine mutase [Synchytrium microbalum]|uniref:Phosphoglucosamine mutase n=1 Tax=Synchytrium microbalum TaxID=1806994 RepID=A0A507CF61_9FUNG|nr:phosphoglucosamine mutase [Synchytrium microbalum]TPX36225.1 phosphoglucosamine mutase [Synchytrium microbalum]